MPNYALLLDGVKYPFSELSYDRDYSLVPQPFSAVIPSLDTVALGALVSITRDDVVVYSGMVTKRSRKPTGSGVRSTISGYDLLISAIYLKAVNMIELDDPADVVTACLVGTDLTAGTIDALGTDLEMVFGGNDEAVFRRDRVLEELALVSGKEVYVSPTGVVDFKQFCGVDRVDTVVWTRGINLLDWPTDYVNSNALLIKKARVLGSGSDSAMRVGTAVTFDYVAGDPEREYNHKSLVSETSCGHAAETILGDWHHTLAYGDILVADATPGKCFDVFDSVRVTDPLILVGTDFGTGFGPGMGEDKFRIYHIARNFKADGGESTVLSLCNVWNMTANVKGLLDAEMSWLSEAERGMHDFGQTTQYGNRFNMSLWSMWESLDGYVNNNGGGGSGYVTVQHGRLLMGTGVTVGSSYTVYGYDTITMAHRPRLKLKFRASFTANGVAWILLGTLGTAHIYMGFAVQPTGITAMWSSGVASNTHVLSTSYVDDTIMTLEVYNDGTKLYYYMDEALVYVTSVDVSTSTLLIPEVTLLVQNTSDAADNRLTCFNYQCEETWK